MPDQPTPTGDLKQALRKAHAAEAARAQAVLAIRDAQTLRLQALKDDLAPVVAATPEARIFDLVLMPGNPPRLWIDLVSSIVMEPDPQTYRLVQDTAGGRDLLFETANRSEMAEKVKLHMAHRIIARERQLGVSPLFRERIGYSTSAVILAWISGFSVGLLALAVALVIAFRSGWVPVTF